METTVVGVAPLDTCACDMSMRTESGSPAQRSRITHALRRIAGTLMHDPETLARPRTGLLDRLLGHHQEELEMAESVHALITAAAVPDLQRSAFRQPEAVPGFVKLDWRIGDVQ